ncbi:MAG: MarC family protein [Thermoguttaceae bacterium]|jgi:multiple antibiotic resistance protein
MQDHLQAIITVLTLINPAMCAAIFAGIEAGRPRGPQLADAGKAALAVLVILVLAALFGQRLLGLFGVSLDAFMVAGGSVLAWIGFGMLCGTPAGSQPSGGGAASENRSLTPLILFAASPGTITGVITLAVAQTREKLPVTALVAVSVGALAMWLVIALAVRFGERPHGGSGFVRDTVTRFMGLIVIAMGVQFTLTGIRAFMRIQ